MGEWYRAKIGDLCEIIKGETGLASAPPGPYPLVATGAARRTCVTWQFDTDAVCIPLVSSTGHGKKTLNYVHYQSGKFALGTILAAVIPKDPSILIARFLHLYLSHFKDTVLVPLMKGAANVSLPMKEIASVEIPVPPLDEQQNLIDLIFRIEGEHRELLAETNRQGELLKQLRQAVLQEAVEGKLTAAWRKQHPVVQGDPQYDAAALLTQIRAEKERLVKEGKIRKEKPLPPVSDDGKLFDLPEGWVWCLGEEIGEYIDPQPSHRTPPEVQNGIPYVSMKDVNATGDINFNSARKVSSAILGEHLERYQISIGDFFIGKIGTIGNPVWLSLPQNYTLSANTVLIQPKQSCIDPKLMFYVLKSDYCLRHMSEVSSEMSYPVFGIKKMRLMPFPLPPLAEQQAIVARVDSLMAVIDELEKQVAERKEQAQLLMKTVLCEAFHYGMTN